MPRPPLPRCPTPEQASLAKIETGVRLGLEKRRSDLINDGAVFNRHKAEFQGPAEYMVMLRKWYRCGFEDGCK